MGYGNFTFASEVTYPLNSVSYDLMIVDLNNDSKLDIIATSSVTNKLSVLRGYGNGTFAPQVLFSTGLGSIRNSCVGDINNDSRLDIIIVNNGAPTMSVFFGYGNLTFAPQVVYATLALAYSLSLG